MPIVLSAGSSPSIPGEQLIIDPTDEDTGTETDLVDNVSYVLLEHAYPTPELDPQWVSSAATEGEMLAAEPRYRNRTITAKIRVYGGSATGLLANITALTTKAGKLTREGGTLRRVLPSGDQITFDVFTATVDVPADKRFVSRLVADVTMTFVCAPFGREPDALLGTFSETTRPALIFTVDSVRGDVAALGRLQITEASGNKQERMWWGLNSRYFDPTFLIDNVFIEAESMTGALPAVVAGASGGSVSRHTGLTTSYAFTLAFNLTEIGTFRVLARVNNTGGTWNVRLAWNGSQQAGLAMNAPVTVADAGFSIADLGIVKVEPPLLPTGAVLGGGQIELAGASGGETADVDYVLLLPVDDGSGEAADDSAVGVLAPDAIAEVRYDGYVREIAPGGNIGPATRYEGDYLRVPVAYPVRVIVKVGRTTASGSDGAIDHLGAGLLVTPRWLVVPAP